MNADAHVELISQLTRLEQVLVDEDVALRRFDPVGIAAAAEAKSELEPELERAFAAVTVAPSSNRRAEFLAIRQRVADLGRANLVRLQATLGCVREVVDQATGRTRTTYGRRREPVLAAAPMLASEVG
jgi:hypothetical protein